MKLNEKELLIVTSVYVERNAGQCKSIEKVWTIKIQLRFLIIHLQVIVLFVRHFQHDIFEFSPNMIHKGPLY